MFENFNTQELQENYAKAKENSNNNSNEQLYGTFVVKVDKIELGETSEKSKQPHMPMGKIQFRIVEGQYKNKCLFMNKLLVCRDKEGKLTTIGLKIFDDFLNSLQPTFNVSFSECKDAFKPDAEDNYQNLLLDVAEDIASLTYDIEVKENGGYPVYKVLAVYED